MKTCSSSPDTISWLLRHQTVNVVPLADPLIDEVGYDARGGYTEAYWLSVLGPSALLALRRLNAYIDLAPEGFRFSVSTFARELGLGHSVGRNAPVVRTLARLVSFGLAKPEGDALAIRRNVPPLSRGHLARLPAPLLERHQREAIASNSLAGSRTLVDQVR
jgi:hypothetical protein